MPAHPSQPTLYLALPESADIAAGVNNIVSRAVAKGATLIDPAQVISAEDSFVYRYTANQTSTTGEFCVKPDFRVTSPTTGGKWEFTKPLFEAYTVLSGGCKAPAFRVPNCRFVIIQNPNAGTIYFRKGTPNASGLTIAKPGDANGDDVQGIAIATGGSYVTWPGEWTFGDEIHLLASAASYEAVIAFH